MFSFMEKKKSEQIEDASGRNLRTVAGNDDDSFATRSSRTIGVEDFEDEPKEEGEYTSHSRSFLDAINFDEDELDKDIASGGLSEKEVENMTDSERASRFKVAEFAELTDSQRESRVNFLNESLMAAEGTPGLGDGDSGNAETNGLLAQQDNLMMEEGITMNLLDASDRYQDNFVMIATQRARRKTRYSRYTRIFCFASILTVTFIFSMRYVNEMFKEHIRLNAQEKATTIVDPSEFFELEQPKVVGENTGASAGFTTHQETIYQTIEATHPDRPIPHDGDFVPSVDVGPCTDNPYFLHNGEPGQNCDWVEEMDTVARCTRQGVQLNCPSKCDPNCSAPTTFPTDSPDGSIAGRVESPTEAPTSFPTELPTEFDPNALGFRER